MMASLYNWGTRVLNPVLLGLQSRKLKLLQQTGGIPLQIGGALSVWLSRTGAGVLSTDLERIRKHRKHLTSKNPVSHLRPFRPRDRTSEPASAQPIESRTEQALHADYRTEFWTLFVYQVIRELKPGSVLELGNTSGLPAAVIASALKKNNSGRLVTLADNPELAAFASSNLNFLHFDSVQVISGSFPEELPQILKHVKPVHLAWIHPLNDEAEFRACFDQIFQSAEPGAVLILDCFPGPSGKGPVWESVRYHPGIAFSVKLGPVGLLVTGKSSAPVHLDFFLI